MVAVTGDDKRAVWETDARRWMYPGVAVAVRGYEDLRFVRFGWWLRSGAAVVLVYRGGRAKPWLMVVEAWRLAISQLAPEPPGLPVWAGER